MTKQSEYMSESLSFANSLQALTSPEEPASKRRKVRKGTSSCWQCKGRKKKCVFLPESTICVTCQRLNLSCVSQEYGSESAPFPRDAEQRLNTLENLVHQLAERRQVLDKLGGYPVSILSAPLRYSISDSLRAKCASLSNYLKAALPVPATARLIINIGQSPYNWIWPQTQSCRISQMLAGRGLEGFDLLPTLLQPAILARKLVELALCLLQPAFKHPGFGRPALPGVVPLSMAKTLVDAVQHVTTQDMLIKSIDGLEALHLEALYQIHLGNIELGGQTFRRALIIAQSIELHKLTPKADERVRHLWFRLVYTDRWHALASGRSSCVVDSGLTLPDPAKDMPDTTRLDQWHLVIAGRIIARNVRLQRHQSTGENSLEQVLDREESASIDRDMKSASVSVSLHFWASPSSHCFQDEDAKDTTARIMIQCHQNYLIISTHQPWTLLAMHRGGFDTSTDAFTRNGKVASITAARELLSRIPQFLSYPHLTSSMKGLRHKAYLAATTLLLLHLHNASTGIDDPIGHQVHQDINFVIDAMSHFGDVDDDHEMSTPMSYSTRTLEALMEAVQLAYTGTIYSMICDWCASIRQEDISVTEQVVAFRISYPYFGDVKGYKLGTTRVARPSK